MMNIKSTINTYNNALLLRKYLLKQYLSLDITLRQLIEGIMLCDILLITNAHIINQYGMDKGR